MKSKHPIPLLFRSDIGPAREATDVSDERHQQPVKKKQVKSSNYKCIIEEKKLYEMIVLTNMAYNDFKEITYHYFSYDIHVPVVESF